MPTSNTPGGGRRLLPWFMRWIALVVGVAAVVGWAGGEVPNRTPHTSAASLRNTLGSVPSNAPPGATVAVYGVYFDSFTAGSSVLIEFDDARTILATRDMVTCDNNRGAGFGTECNGQAVEVTIPAGATLGAHRLVLETNTFGNNIQLATAPFTVDRAPNPTSTPTVTATNTATETKTPTATATDTATGTVPPTATPSQTTTITALPSTPTATARPVVPSWTPSSTPTMPLSQPATAPSVSVSELQHVQGGCVPTTNRVGSLSASTTPRGPATVYKGGQQLLLDAAHLPANTALDLVIIAPRAVISGRVSTTVDYSPPVTQVRTDSRGRLHSSVVLPDDLDTGPGMVQAFLHVVPRGVAHPTLLTTWGFTGAPRDPILQVSVRDGSGKPVRGADVTYLPNGATTETKINLTDACGRISDGSGNAVFSSVPAGPSQVIVSLGGTVIGSAAPIALTGAIVSAVVSDHAHGSVACAAVFSAVQYIWDEESGGGGASSGEGPFGTFISGVRTMDSFSAVFSNKLGRNTPITLSFVNGNGPAALSVKGYVAQAGLGGIPLREPSGGLAAWNRVTAGVNRIPTLNYGPIARGVPSLAINTSHVLLDVTNQLSQLQALSTLSVVFPPVDLGKLAPGNWFAGVTVGSSPNCPTLYPLKMIANPWQTPFGTIRPVYDHVDHAYYASDSLPNSGAAASLLHFQQPHVNIGWDDYDVAGIVTIPGVQIPFPELASSDLGVDINERLFTNGKWDGSLSAHAHVKMIGVSLLDRQLPTFNGSGTQITRDSVPLFEYPAVSNQPLFSAPLAIVPVGFPGVADAELKITFNMHGSVDIRLGVGAVLDRVSFTFEPAITAGLEAAAHVDFVGQSAGVSVNGGLTLQAPVTVTIPGGIDADLAVRFGVGGHAYARFCFITCDGPSVNFTIIPTFCVLGNCGAVANLVNGVGPSVRGGMLVAGRGAGFTMAGPQSLSHATLPATSTARQSAQGTIHAAPKSSVYPAQPAIDISPAGHGAALWVSNAGGRVRLLAAMDGGPTQTIATSSAQIAGPHVAWIGGNQAIAVWVGNTATTRQIAALHGANSGNGYGAVVAALSRQEIYSAVWDGTAWSAPRRLTKDGLADSEPALTGDVGRHTATLAWIHATEDASLRTMMQATELRISRYASGHWTSAETLATAKAGGVHSPAIAGDRKGQVTLAWVAGSGINATTKVGSYVNGAVHPRAIPGFGQGAVHLSLAFDGDGRPVVAADGAALSVARLGSSGHWTMWTLGPGSQPQLISERDGSVALSSLPGTGDPLQPLGVPSLRIMPPGGTFGDPLTVPGTSKQTIAIAIAADPRTGAVQALNQTTTATSKRAMDTGMHVAPVAITAGGKLSLVSNGISLNPPQPRPGTRAKIRVTVRNAGFTTLRPGGQVVVRIDPSHVTLHLRVTRALAPGATVTLAGNVIAAKTAMTATAHIGNLAVHAVLALPPAPIALGSTSRSGSGGLQLEWSPAGDTDVTTYRVYRGVGRQGPLSLAGIATSMQWLDMTWASHTAYRYQVTAVDAYGRESALSAPLNMVAS